MVRSVMLFGLETAPFMKAEEKKLDVAEMEMLTLMSGAMREDKLRNEYIRESFIVVEVSKKVQEARLRWFGHVMLCCDEQITREVIKVEVQERRRRGRPRTRWKYRKKADKVERGLSFQDCEDTINWRRVIQNRDP